MAFPESREQLVILLGLAEECGVQPFLLGRGTNLLVSDRGLDTWSSKRRSADPASAVWTM